MRIPKQAQRQADSLFKACSVSGVPDFQKVLQAIELLISERPRGWRQIAEHLKKRTRLELARRTVCVQSAAPLDEAQQTEITRSIRARHPGLPLEFNFAVIPELLGGLRVQIGWKVLDATIQSRLESLLESNANKA
ncbi:MAG: F0F1 ATP synthase subunit delta [Verrucomicrobia bacterium]|nr:F0F1 ATP synthase subunit delta [Verrucomicrobiota bacterium]MBR5691025.1 F0F1 ATP synthase subunit delta [Verrucomicrobiota bacterium]MBR6461065.1 F0F1 ATP synthase subunit delta [Verrucomicrobiota bacterium]MBR6464680.1 F0F1 ATP synthase subunit delta [Verrucomicrobiota bacterium]